MIDYIVLFKTCLYNCELMLEMYDLTPRERYKLNKIKGDLEVYLREKDINTANSNNK